ncbi:DNA mismatch repair endonuclease MutL [Salinirubellus salinus]|uniref:DNA mismatch repair protein MutL n=1 Tax=Salinirubellus salinus TaxID=1364945 RepID=A0A9E7R336_9EURY|nr:DNA mismatch repair endonuclease MutL [Salinirubellus salinus]UWM53740.1 DNA mismatch repair endonuclease MutL [Salinirubellus salinus]
MGESESDEREGEGEIRRLDDATVRQIAAGEVVERPASAVKELVENAIDADASRVTVTVDDGGKGAITVRDDGRGMTEREVREAVKEHTTSKLRDIDDLESGIGTLGFRGEALYAIGGVSRLTVRTRKQGTATGTELTVEGGEVTDVSPVGCPEGTTVEVRDLFYNVPARRKYLKQDSTEFAHVNRVVTGYALANPDVAVTLEHGDRETFATTGQGDLQAAVLSVYGREVAANMVPVEGSGEGPLGGVSGLVSHPETTRASRDYLTVFVNGRYVTASAVREAVVAAYDTQLAPDRYPFAVVSLDLDPGSVDVNVHPRKMEVRFSDEDAVRRQVRTAVRDALLDAGLVRSSAPRGRSQAEQTEISPERAVRESDSLAGTGAEPRRAAGRWRDESVDEDGVDLDPAPGDDVDRPAPPAEREASVEFGPETRWRADDDGDDTGADSEPEPAPASEPAQTADRDGTTTTVADDPHRRFSERPAQATLGDGADTSETVETPAFDRLPAMRVLGQYDDTYLVAETDDGLLLIDQHAADERVNYEALRERFAGDVATQTLVSPVEVEVTAREADLFRDGREALSRLGFRADLVDDRTVAVRTVPATLADAEAPELVRDLLSDLVHGDPAETVSEAVDHLLGDMACYPAIKGNESLGEGTVVSLLEELDACENPYACPHGRPVLLEFSRDEIEDRFERDYPGHQGRRD